MSRIEEASRSQEEDSQHYRAHKTDKHGNYRYYDDSEDDKEDYFSEEEEESKHSAKPRQSVLINRTFTGTADINRETLQAQCYDRTFILSGPVVKVYQTAEEGLGFVREHAELQHVTDMPLIMGKDHEPIIPTNLLLHDNEGQMVFKNEKEPSELFLFDLESGKVVQEIKTGKEKIKFEQINNDMKNGQKDVSRTLIGCESQGLHTIDPRIGDNALAVSKTYKTNPLFNTIAPGLDGAFVVGSANGDVRMYKQMGQIAKTHLPGLGEPIKAIDVSQDQKWMLVTC